MRSLFKIDKCALHKSSIIFRSVREYANAAINKVVQLDTLSNNIRNMNLALTERLVTATKRHILELEKGQIKPFKEVIFSNINDRHHVNEIPLTFSRQLSSLALYPALMDKPIPYPSDVKKRVRKILDGCDGWSVGSSTDAQGLWTIRNHIADYITKRDHSDTPVDPNNIFIADSISTILEMVLSLFCVTETEKPIGVAIPVPHHPLYSALLTVLGLSKIYYYLDESKNWALTLEELERAIYESKSYCTPKVLIISNPGNPAGNVIPRRVLEKAVKLAYKENLFILADEVYQSIVYNIEEELEFNSLRSVMTELGMPYSQMELMSFHSAAIGISEEGGFCTAYAELFNVDEEIKDQLMKLASLSLCPNVPGQIILDGMVCPPGENEPSYQQYTFEKDKIFEHLQEMAKNIEKRLNSIRGINCSTIQGALYAFPRVDLTKIFEKNAKTQNLEPDELFCLEFLNEKGILLLPGCSFGQKDGTYHFRLTLLSSPEKLEYIIEELNDFMEKFYFIHNEIKYME